MAWAGDMTRLALLPLLFALGGCAATIDQQGQDTIAQLRAVTDADLSQAMQLAILNKDTAAQQCIIAITNVVQTLRTFNTVGAATIFQAGMDITNPGGYLNVECAAERANVKARVQLFIGSTATLLATFGL